MDICTQCYEYMYEIFRMNVQSIVAKILSLFFSSFLLVEANSESDLNEFKDLLARFFAEKAQREIEVLWNEGIINEETIEQWGGRAHACNFS